MVGIRNQGDKYATCLVGEVLAEQAIRFALNLALRYTENWVV